MNETTPGARTRARERVWDDNRKITDFTASPTGLLDAGPFAGLPAHAAGVILADPPWYFQTYSRKGWKKSAHAQYPCMPIADIATLPVAELCATDCVLALWVTQTHLPDALQVMTAWGFAFKTAGAWAKQSKTARSWQFGTGYLLRSAAEFFLIGTSGRPRQLSRSTRNLIVAPVREHSRKPDDMYALIEATWPGPYVELFARYRRDGWLSWPVLADCPMLHSDPGGHHATRPATLEQLATGTSCA